MSRPRSVIRSGSGGAARTSTDDDHARAGLHARRGRPDAAQWAREVKKLLSCGAAVAGHERVDGVDTIKLRLSSSYHRACAGSNSGGRCQPESVGWSRDLWANA